MPDLLNTYSWTECKLRQARGSDVNTCSTTAAPAESGIWRIFSYDFFSVACEGLWKRVFSDPSAASDADSEDAAAQSGSQSEAEAERNSRKSNPNNFLDGGDDEDAQDIDHEILHGEDPFQTGMETVELAHNKQLHRDIAAAAE